MQEKEAVISLHLSPTIHARIRDLAKVYGLSDEEVIIKALVKGFFQAPQDPSQLESGLHHLSCDDEVLPAE